MEAVAHVDDAYGVMNYVDFKDRYCLHSFSPVSFIMMVGGLPGYMAVRAPQVCLIKRAREAEPKTRNRLQVESKPVTGSSLPKGYRANRL